MLTLGKTQTQQNTWVQCGVNIIKIKYLPIRFRSRDPFSWTWRHIYDERARHVPRTSRAGEAGQVSTHSHPAGAINHPLALSLRFKVTWTGAAAGGWSTCCSSADVAKRVFFFSFSLSSLLHPSLHLPRFWCRWFFFFFFPQSFLRWKGDAATHEADDCARQQGEVRNERQRNLISGDKNASFVIIDRSDSIALSLPSPVHTLWCYFFIVFIPVI